MLIEIDFDSDEAIYVQLCNQIIMGIAASVIHEGDSLPSVRQLADMIGVNMHTVNKAYSVLKREGYISEERFAEVFIRSRLRKLPEGKALLAMRLRERGCAEDAARKALSEAWEREDYLEPLISYMDELTRKKGEAKAYAALMHKGFSPTEVRRARAMLSERAVDELE